MYMNKPEKEYRTHGTFPDHSHTGNPVIDLSFFPSFFLLTGVLTRLQYKSPLPLPEERQKIGH
jgi:hypothetical protein